MNEPTKANGHGQEPTQIIPAEQAQLAAVGRDETVEQKLARAEKQIAYRKGILRLIAANIDPADVALFGEGEKQTIHLTKTACKQILAWAGITVQPDNAIQEKRYEGSEGPYIDFEVWATWFTPDGRYYRAMGNRSTYDDFFAKRTRYSCSECGAPIKWNGNDAFCAKDNKKVYYKKDDYYLPLTEVDIPAIKQAAITNLWNHVVEDAGLKPSRKELAEVGFKFSDVGQRVEFGGDKKRAAAQAPAQPSAQATQGAAGSAPPAAKPPQQAPPPAASAPKPTLPPKAEIPAAPAGLRPPLASSDVLKVGVGVVKTAYLNKVRGKETRYVKLTQGNETLFCFHDTMVVTSDGDKNLLDLLVSMRGQKCEFIVKTNPKDGRHAIEGAMRIGPYAWGADGTPILEREPGDGRYEATDDDLAF